MIVCIGCGCDELHACIGDRGPHDIVPAIAPIMLQSSGGVTIVGATTCSWVALDREAGRGLCSRCAAMPLAELLEKASL